ncbi:MAG: LLM class F420-dependent oxidoreductase [Actinobacteria bacterium]|nr:LLM class F420-dependent oxidoreductase [Actinomycetota bacterium]
MEFGVFFANTGRFSTGEGAEAIARAAEDAGFDSVWTVEHVLVPDGYESEYPYDKSGKMPGGTTVAIPDPLIWLSYVGAVAKALKLGTGILIVPQRNPAVLAKEVATLDHLTGGRALLGVGAGWLEEEFDALGVPFEGRGRRLDAYIDTMRALWRDDRATVDNEFVSFKDAVSLPHPVGGSVPIVVGGHSLVAARRAGRLGDGFFPGRGEVAQLVALLDEMRAAATEAGRDPGTIEVTAGTAAIFAPDAVDQVKRLEELGVSRIVVPPLSFRLDEIGGALGQFGENLIAKVKG